MEETFVPALSANRQPAGTDIAETSVPSVITRPPTSRRSRVASGHQRRIRAVVLEANEIFTPPDRLDEEFHIAARLPASAHAEQLASVLKQARPRLLLLKHSLESIDERIVAVCRSSGVEIMVLARPVYGLLRAPTMRRFGGLPWIRLRTGPGPSGGERLKRCFDLALILLSAVLVIPLMLLIATAVAFTGPPFYRQQRVGAGGRLFRVVKFRTMRVGAERHTGPVLVKPGDTRITRIGAVLRRWRLDELPQLWNVVRGEMSLVGPRPERPEFIREFQQLPHYDLRHLIRPGLTGIAQLTGGYAATVEDKLRCDLLYLNCRSLRVDLTLLALTVIELFRGFPRG